MITPVNNHLLIQPMKHEAFIATQRETYEEIGEVLAVPPELMVTGSSSNQMRRVVNVGDKVYFDSWLAAKFPSDVEGEHYWLVNWNDVRAVVYADAS
jgi:co-chaperonin GroES (HSP10)